MKIKIVAAAVIFFQILSCSVFAQNFFPLEISNKCEYQVDYQFHGPGGTGSGTYYGKYFINKDSVINDQTFYKLDQFTVQLFYGDDEGNYLFRYDSTQNKLFVKLPEDDTVRLAVDFNIPNDSVFTSYIQGEPKLYTSLGIEIDTIFGYPVQTFKMTYNFSSDNGSYTFADKFGIVQSDNIWSSGTLYGSNSDRLISAVIDSTIYNPLTLEITGLHPLIDRPINTFPFVLHITWDATIPGLVDSLYVDIIHTRSDSVINSWRLNFNGHQVNVPIYPSDLEVSDIIKIRATITDESIFNNVVHYPDSGYAYIHVLDPVTSVLDENQPYEFSLSQNYPNPFNPSTTIEYTIGERKNVLLKIYNLLGIEVAALENEVQSPGNYKLNFNADDFNLPSGVYFYRISSGSFIECKKMIIMR
ncbi:hypothetical protein BMS3Abin03_01384 [bacterium BMS3Abin03]|nr:hypothetical protein BMS3Abin03_01384 [bacterium BMS3Abin03]